VPNPQYSSFPYIYSSKGLNARNTIDRMPDHTYWNLDNAECRQENSIASRLGRTVISAEPPALGGINAPLADLNVHTLARLKGLEEPTRYAGAGTNLYRGTIPLEVSSYNAINGAFIFSGNRFSTANYRPANTGNPAIFFADSNVMVKDFGISNPLQRATVEQWGIFPPTAPPTLSLNSQLTTLIDNFDAVSGSYSYNNFTGTSSVTVVNTTLTTAVTTAPGLVTVTPVSMTNIVPNSALSVNLEHGVFVTAVTDSTFTAFFQSNHPIGATVLNNGITGTAGAGSSGVYLAFTGNLTQGNFGDGNITIGLEIATPANVVQINVYFDVSPGTFSEGASPGSYAARVSTGLPITSTFQEFSIPLSSFVPQGTAGSPGMTWANITNWYIGFVTSAPTVITIADFSYVNGAGPSVLDGGVPYDYRITFYNENTGDESGPSVVMIPSNFISPLGQPVTVNFAAAVTPPPPIDPQITDIRIYRRGGTLPNQWLQVGQVPIGTTSFVDTLTDQQIATNNILTVDTAPPVTSTLSIPVNTTLTAAIAALGENTVALGSLDNVFVNQMVTIDPLLATEETVIVQAITGTDITAYFQYLHANGALVQASTRSGQPCNIATIAFNIAWVAGDPNNPDILYYSAPSNPESFPVENFVELGTPSDPIMGIVEWNGQLYVFTQNTVWNILGAQGGSVPFPYKTAADHGLNAMFGWTLTEGEIYYQSFGGIYAFQGAASRYASADIEWIFTAQFIKDDIQRAVVLMDPTQASQTLMAYFQNEIYVSYIGLDGNRHRVIFDQVHQRWRNDDVPANSMLVQEDIYTFLFGGTNGLIYQDRTGNFDSGGSAAATPILFNVQTSALDMGMPKNFKNFNEFTIDIDTGGLPVTITLLFDYGLTPVSLGTVTTTAGRQQVDFQINAGQGQLSLNVSVKLTASITTNISSPIEVYEAHIRATAEAELRKSFDSYIMDYGSPDYKFVKQSWIEYYALDVAGIIFNCYVGGSTTPVFTFTLPQSMTRTSKRVRHPATKGRIWRWVATSNSDFRLYSDSRNEWKSVTQDKGYQVRPLQQETPQQP
jgi:hypothetical protein